jgi:type IV pilus assembly protein PilB
MKLGEILLEAGLMSRQQLRQALDGHKKQGVKLGQYLVLEGIVSESQIVEVLSRQLKIQKYRAEDYPVSTELSRIIPVQTAHRHQVAPLLMQDHLLTVAMVDPLDIRAFDAVQHITGAEIKVTICSERQLNQLLTGIYGSFAGMDGLLKGAEEMTIDKASQEVPDIEDVEMSSLQDMAEEAPVVALVNSILSQAIRDGASDVHINPAKEHIRIRFRIDGILQPMPSPPRSMFLPMVSRLKILAGMDISVARIPQDGRFTVKMRNKDINIRASTIPTIYGENVVLRLLDTSSGVNSLSRLGMSQQDVQKIERALMQPYGMILSTGPTGSGKSTSLYSILKMINRPEVNIVTVEDPVEYRLDGIQQVQLNTRAGMTFAGGLRSILRQDPDVIMVGEIRDPETASVAVQAALTGHRVLSTLHTNDAAGAFTRFLDMGVEPFLVASVMAVSFAQRLVRRVCSSCSEPYTPVDEIRDYWGLGGIEEANFVRSTGCMNCMHTGYKGRVGVYEVLPLTEEIQHLILKRASAQEIATAAINSGKLIPLKENALEKIVQGVTTLEEAASAVLV